ncbi:FAD-dependent oxidoreductase [Cohnella rhizosphaerae]|uniref:FAD-dependent oxidoreductase n=1 Tax=Cohnella rhizosphaerae TaxID=1457232 RepID=A0A9X4L1I2_9BACL|nr:FAD-dependent oxidoreductase [Cohnella rhizosphaerae]MDG0811822.1 FAD-dependent oxidoreductase [Cohnella rhizosphaerae]
MPDYQAVVIGGGFYGCSIAIKLKEYFKSVLLIEKESDLMSRASLVNQARVHNGYHYPRNLVTAYRSYVNFPRFIHDYNACIEDEFDKIYAIARYGSKVNAYQFLKMFKEIGAPIKPASSYYRELFNQNLIEEVFEVKEVAFNAVILKQLMTEQLQIAGVELRMGTEVLKVEQYDVNRIKLQINEKESITADRVYNCTYSQINKLMSKSNMPLIPFKHEVTEMALINMPERLKRVGITVMDGPFFSTMPYPSKNLHSLSHVRYTPHFSWVDLEQFMDGHNYLKEMEQKSNYIYMLRDVERFLPLIKGAEYVHSIFEVKTILLQNERDDGRPILSRDNYGIHNFTNIMGGKIDNIYDILGVIEERFNYAGAP